MRLPLENRVGRHLLPDGLNMASGYAVSVAGVPLGIHDASSATIATRPGFEIIVFGTILLLPKVGVSFLLNRTPVFGALK